MQHDPTPDEYGEDHPIIQLAVHALRAFGADLDRETAGRLLPMWEHYSELSPREVAAVLRRFPERPSTADAPDAPDGVEGIRLGSRYATCPRCHRRVPVLGGRLMAHTRPDAGDHCRDSGRPVTGGQPPQQGYRVDEAVLAVMLDLRNAGLRGVISESVATLAAAEVLLRSLGIDPIPVDPYDDEDDN